MEINITHRVPLTPAARVESCWAAAAAMLYHGGRPRAARRTAPPETSETSETSDTGSVVATAAAVPHPPHVGAATIAQFAREWELEHAPCADWTAPGLARILQPRPLWAGAYLPNGHAMVLAGLFGDGTPGGTHVTVFDPLPADAGSVYTLPFSVWSARYPLRSMQLLFRPPVSVQPQATTRRTGDPFPGG